MKLDKQFQNDFVGSPHSDYSTESGCSLLNIEIHYGRKDRFSDQGLD